MADDKHTLLICTVGGSPEPIVKSLMEWQPARVIFVPSEQTKSHVDSVLRHFHETTGTALSPGCFRICPVPDAEDLGGCLQVVASLENEVRDWLQRGEYYRLVADLTAATKCMSAALALQASRWPCQFSYVGGARRTKEGVGIVETGSERIVYSANPWDALGFQAAEDFATLFDQQAFAAAAALAERAMKNAGEQSRKRELNALRLLADAYDAWDRFDHKAAISKLQDLAKYENDLLAVLGENRADQIRSTARHHSDYLQSLVDGGSPSQKYVVDLLANAQRRQSEGRTDDAVARLYRAIESLAQVALAERHEITTTKHVPLDRIPESLREQWAPRADKGNVFLGLQDAYALLDALEDELGQRFLQLQLHDRERSPLTARNQSILAHGFERVSDKVFGQLWQASLQLVGIAQGDLPAFLKVAR